MSDDELERTREIPVQEHGPDFAGEAGPAEREGGHPSGVHDDDGDSAGLGTQSTAVVPDPPAAVGAEPPPAPTPEVGEADAPRELADGTVHAESDCRCTQEDRARYLDELAELRSLLDRRAAESDATIRGLHATIETVQRRQLMDMMKPAVARFADLHAELLSAADAAQVADDEGAQSHASDLRYFAQSIETILDNFDLESVAASEGMPFDRRLHAAVLTKPTVSRDKDQTIARVVRQGFRVLGSDRVALPARVVVWKFSADLLAPEAPEPDAATPGSPSMDEAPAASSTDNCSPEIGDNA